MTDSASGRNPPRRSMKRRNKTLVVLTACGMAAALSAGVSAAYLTDGETAVNTFTVGKVLVELTEPNYTPEDDVPRVPNQEIRKDPTIVNTGNNDEIVFVSFDIPMAEVRLAGYDGTPQENPSSQELFGFRADTGTYSSVNSGWVRVGAPEEVDADNDGEPDYKTYVYGYNRVVRAAVEAKAAVGNPGEDGYTAAVDAVEATKVPPVFDYIRLANIVEGQLDGERLEVPVRAYAIQADFLQASDNSQKNDILVTGDDMTEETLSRIFHLYQNQNQTGGSFGVLSGWTGADSILEKTAGEGNLLDLIGTEH